MKTINNIINEKPYSDQDGYGYLLKNTKNNMWYCGIAKGSPDDEKDYTTSSTSSDLLFEISEDRIEREILTQDTYENLTYWEYNYCTERNAKKDPMSYNEHNGIVKKKDKINYDIEIDNKMFKIANIIKKKKSYKKNKLKYINIKNRKKTLQQLVKESIYNELLFLQVRDYVLVPEHINDIATLIDDAKNVKKVKQKLMIVVLKNRTMYCPDTKRNITGDWVIGGNHTFHAIMKSKFGFYLPILEIAKEDHEEFSDIAIKSLSLYLNEIQTEKVLYTNLDTIANQIVDMLDSDSEMTLNDPVITNKKKNLNLSSKEKTTVTRKVNKILEEREEEKTRPSNFVDYKVDKFKKVIDNLKDSYKDNKQTMTKVYSTGKAAIGDLQIKIMNRYYNDKINYKTVNIILHHPSMTARKKYMKEYAEGMRSFTKTVKLLDVKVNVVEMPHTLDVLKKKYHI